MLIKKRKLISISNSKSTARTLQPEYGEMNKARQEAKQIKQDARLILAESEKKLKEAEAKAKEIISNTNLEAKAIKEKVYQETIQAANEEAELIKEQAKMVLRELFEVKREALTRANKEIIKIALDLAEKIIRYKVSLDPNILQTQVIEAIKKATSEADRVQVFVNPNDLKTLEESIPQMERLFPSGIDIIPLANDSVDPGSCIVETKSGQLDARFSTQLQALTDLINHIDTIEPHIEINEEISAVKEALFVEVEQEEKSFQKDKDELTEAEKKVLEEELLYEGPLPFVSSEQLISPPSSLELKDEELEELQEQDVLNIPKEIIQSTEQKALESKEKEEPKQKKKLNTGNISERTKEEAEELDEGLVIEYEDEKPDKEETKSVNILKPKKPKSQEVSNLASELGENPEWKDLVEEDEE